MADTFTANYNFTLVEIGASRDTWGAKTNTNMTSIDTNLKTISDLVNTNNTNVTAAYKAWVPIGVVVMWGLASAVPSGFAICDGRTVARSDGGGNITTPNLISKFIRASLTFGGTGGANSVTVSTDAKGGHDHGGKVGGTSLTIAQMPAHTHSGGFVASLGATTGPQTQGDSGGRVTGSSGGGAVHDHTISTIADHTHNVTVSVLPSYFSMIYIMRI